MDYQNDPWADALAQQENEWRSQRDAQMQGDQAAVNDEMGEVVRRNAMENAKRQMSFNNLLASAVKYSNGGELPEVVRNYMNRKMGFDGVKTGVLGGGYQQDGSYAFDFANGVDQQGAVVRQRQSFGPTSLYNMMSQNRVAFNDADRSSMRKNLLHLGYSEKEVSDMDYALAMNHDDGDREAYREYMKNYKTSAPDHISNQMSGGAGGREIGSGAVMKKVDRRPRDVEMYSNFREPGMTAGGYVSGRKADGTRYGYNLGRQKSEAELWHQFLVGPASNDMNDRTQVRGYKNELTGEVVYVKDGENPPWRQAQGNNGKLSVDDRLAIEREKNKGKIDVENARGQNRIDLANLTGEQKKELQNSINAMKKYGIDVTNNTKMSIADKIDAREREIKAAWQAVKKYGIDANNATKIDIAKLNDAQKRDLAEAQNTLKRYGIDANNATKIDISKKLSEDRRYIADEYNKVRMALGGSGRSSSQSAPFNKDMFTYYANQIDLLGSKGNLTEGEKKRLATAERVVEAMTNGAMGWETQKQETPDWMSAFASGDAANTAKPQNREGQKPAQNAPTQKPSNTQGKQATAAQKQDAAPQGEPQTANEQTAPAKSKEQKRETVKLTPAEQSVGRDAVAMFKKIHPDITDVDDNPEKYDKQLTSIAQSLSGDYNYKSNFALQKERDRKAAQDKELQQTAAEQENLRKQTLANLNGRDKAVYQKAMELYAPLYERAKLQAREDHGGDYEESVRKKFAEYVNEYNKKHGLKFTDGLSRPDRQVFGDYHVADLLSDIFGNDAGKYLGPVGSRGNSQLRLQSHGKNK